jgi:DNA (cytosine-5)-methyltransferase 1
MQYSGISLFSGAGGMDVGFKAAGFKIVWANDIVPAACETYQANHGDVIACGDLNTYFPILTKFQETDVVFGGPPCQGFSVAGKMDPDDPRSALLFSFIRALEIVRPKAFVLENVKALGVLAKWKPFRERIFRDSRNLGYTVSMVILNSSDFGVPQSRERVFFIGFRDISNLSGLEEAIGSRKKKALTLRELLSEIGPAGSQGNTRVCRAKVTMAAKPVLRKSAYAGMLFNGQGRPLNPDGYCSTLPASMGGNRTPIIDEDHLYAGKASWVEAYHKQLMAGEPPVPFESAPTRLRRLTIDETIRIQTFPSNYVFKGGQSAIFTQIGNAVPCKLAEVIASTVAEGLTKNSFSHHVNSNQNKQLSLEVP